MFPSTAVNPTQPIEPEVARNGNIYNIWTLNLKTNELHQFTDASTGNVSPVVLRDEKQPRSRSSPTTRVNTGIHTLDARSRSQTALASDFGEAGGPIIDFQPPLSHTLVKANQQQEGHVREAVPRGRPPVNVGVTSGGDLFGGTQVTFTDVLGDKQFNIFAASVSQYRTMSLSLHEPVAALPVRAAGLLADAVLLRQPAACFYDPAYYAASSIATTRSRRRRRAAARRSASTR